MHARIQTGWKNVTARREQLTEENSPRRGRWAAGEKQSRMDRFHESKSVQWLRNQNSTLHFVGMGKGILVKTSEESAFAMEQHFVEPFVLGDVFNVILISQLNTREP
jgi:hypothetical protein